METRNPDREAIDTRMLSVKLEEEGNAPPVEPTQQNNEKKEDGEKEPMSEENVKEASDAAPNVGALLDELDRFEIRTLEDLRNIRKAVMANGGMQ